MALPDNRPQLQTLKDRLGSPIGVTQPVIDLTAFPDSTLQGYLDAGIAWVEDVCATAFNGRIVAPSIAGEIGERYDGNGTNALTLRKRPATSVILVSVETPILGFIRTYQPNEIKLYRKQNFLKIFTYKLAVEQALLNTLDYQAWGTIFPPLPQCVRVNYTYGYPLYDPLQGTSVDGGVTWAAGDQRDPEETNWLTNLQQAALAHAHAMFLAHSAGLKVGFIQSVSFDGYSKSLSGNPYGAAIQSALDSRDELLKRRRKTFHMATAG